jgi:hypothetical protein
MAEQNIERIVYRVCVVFVVLYGVLVVMMMMGMSFRREKEGKNEKGRKSCDYVIQIKTPPQSGAVLMEI